MAYKGLVMESTNDYIIVLTDDANYVKLKNKGDIDVGKKIMFLEEDIVKEKNNYSKSLIGFAAAIILLVTTILGQFGFNLIGNFETYAIVSLDINPSIEFKIDKKKIVRDVKSLNEDGWELIDEKMVGMKIEDAVVFSIKSALNKQYLNNENNVILVSDVVIDEGIEHSTLIEDKIFQKVEEEKGLEDIDVIYVDSDKEDLEKARENQVSVGKYKVYEIVSKNNPDVKIEDVKDKKVSEIVKENKELTKGENVKTKKKNIKKEDDKSDKKDNKSKQNRKREMKKSQRDKKREKANKKNKIRNDKKDNKGIGNNKKEKKKEQMKRSKENSEEVKNDTKKKKESNKKINKKIKKVRERIKKAREKRKNAKAVKEDEDAKMKKANKKDKDKDKD